MKSIILFSVDKNGATNLLCTHSREDCLMFGEELVGEAPSSMILPLDGAQDVLGKMSKVISEKIAEIKLERQLGEDLILDLAALTSLYYNLSKIKPNNRLFSHFQIEMV